MRLNWDLSNLHKDKEYLIELLEKTTDPAQKAKVAKVLDGLNQSIDLKTYPCASFNPSLNFLLVSAMEDYPAFGRYYSIIEKFFFTAHNLHAEIDETNVKFEKLTKKEIDFTNLTGCKFSNHKAINIAKDFLIDLDDKISKDFSHIFDSDKYNISFTQHSCSRNCGAESVGISTFIPFANNYYVSVDETEGFSKVSNLVHEFGHTLNYYYAPEIIFTNNKLFTAEVASIFPEVLFFFNNFGNGDCISAQYELYKTFTTFYEAANYLTYRKLVVDIWKKCGCKTNLKFFKEVKIRIKYPLYLLKNLLSCDLYDLGVYIVSFEIALELAYIYLVKNNKDKALSIYKRIISNSSEDELAIIYKELELGAHTEEMIKLIINKSKESIKEFENNENMGFKLHK